MTQVRGAHLTETNGWWLRDLCGVYIALLWSAGRWICIVLLTYRSSGAGSYGRLMAPEGTAEQDAPPTDWVEAELGRLAFLLAW